MYSWKTLSRLGVALLCLPLLHLAYLAWGAYAAMSNPSPDTWKPALQRIIDQDQGLRLPSAPVLVTGGHSARLWTDLPAAISERPTLLRPLGGATLEDISYHYDRLIGYYRPSVLIVVPSYSDLHLRDEKTPESLVEALSALLSRNTALAVTSRRYVVIPTKTLLHPHDDERIDEMARASRMLARSLPFTAVLDPNPLLATRDGEPNPAYFRSDGINLNDEGYAVLSAMVRKQLIADRLINAPS